MIFDPPTDDFGIAGSVGPGIGGSVAIDETVPILTINDVYYWGDSIIAAIDCRIPDPMPGPSHRYPIGTGNCLRVPDSRTPRFSPDMIYPWTENEVPLQSPSEENETHYYDDDVKLKALDEIIGSNQQIVLERRND